MGGGGSSETQGREKLLRGISRFRVQGFVRTVGYYLAFGFGFRVSCFVGFLWAWVQAEC